MSVAEELHEIEEMYARGTLTPQEFASAKARVLAGGDAARTRRGRRAARLDREWERDRQDYLEPTRDGGRRVPDGDSAWVLGALAGGGAIYFAITAFGGGPTRAGDAMCLLACLVGVAAAVLRVSKAEGYGRAERRYREKRARLLEGPSEGRDGAER